MAQLVECLLSIPEAPYLVFITAYPGTLVHRCTTVLGKLRKEHQEFKGMVSELEVSMDQKP